MPSHPARCGPLARSPRLAPYVAPFILVCIAVLQIFLARQANLSPWKGGGFGMFSTVAKPDARIVRGYLLTDQDESFPLWLPREVDGRVRRVRCLPSPFQVEKLAHELEALPWAVGRVTPFAIRYATYRRQYETAHPDQAPVAAAEPPAQPVLLTAPAAQLQVAKVAPSVTDPTRHVMDARVAIEVWQLRFDGRAHLLRLEPLTALNAEPHER